MEPSFKVVFLGKKKVLAGPVNNAQDPLKNIGCTKRKNLAAIQTYTKCEIAKESSEFEDLENLHQCHYFNISVNI